MPKPIEYYGNIGRRVGGDEPLAKIRAIFRAYAEPGMACVYDKSRTFALEIKDLLAQGARDDMSAFVARINRHFQSKAMKKRIKHGNDFHHALRAINQILPEFRFQLAGEGDFITLRTSSKPLKPVAVEMPISSFQKLPAFQDFHERLMRAVSAPIVDKDAVTQIEEECRKGGAFSFSDLIKHRSAVGGGTALHACIQAYSSDDYRSAASMISHLIASHAEVNAQDDDGNTPLMRAAMMRVDSLAQHLHFNHSADCSIPNRLGFRPDSYVVLKSGRAISKDLSVESAATALPSDVVSAGGAPAHTILDLLAAAQNGVSAFTATPQAAARR